MHRINYANANIKTSLRIPVLKSTFAVNSIGGSGSSPVMKIGSFGGFIEGIISDNDNHWSTSNIKVISANTSC